MVNCGFRHDTKKNIFNRKIKKRIHPFLGNPSNFVGGYKWINRKLNLGRDGSKKNWKRGGGGFLIVTLNLQKTGRCRVA